MKKLYSWAAVICVYKEHKKQKVLIHGIAYSEEHREKAHIQECVSEWARDNNKKWYEILVSDIFEIEAI